MADQDEAAEESRESETNGDVYEVDRIVSRADGAATLRWLSEGVATGAVELADGVTAAVPKQFELEIEYEADAEGAELEVELEWSVADGEAGPTAADSDVADPESAAEVDGELSDAAESDAVDGDTSDSGTAAPTVDAEPVDSEPVDAEPVDAESVDAESVDAESVAAGTVATGDESKARFELFQDRASEWRWRLVHDNGNIIASSGEGYSRKSNARKGLESVMRNASGAAVVEQTE